MSESTGPWWPLQANPSSPTRSASPVLALVLEQRQRWRDNDRVAVEAYLQQQPDLGTDAEAVLDLIYNEILLREERGETPHLEEYLARFPQLADGLRLQFEVHGAIRAEEDKSLSSTVMRERPAGSTDLARQAVPLPKIAGYEVLGLLGRGGMGVVYKARHLQLKRLVALKMILAGSHAGPRELARFRVEAEAAARLQHPHIVQIFEVGEQAGLPYFSLEYVDGGSLHKQLDGKPLPARPAAQLMETLARAVHYAHQKGIIHRDLKPANILLTRVEPSSKHEGQGQPETPGPQTSANPSFRLEPASFVPKITDFGLARQLEHDDGLTQSDAILGTPSYMPPEQALGQRNAIGPAADVYALGAILYELLTARPPFQGATMLDTLEQVRSQEPVAPRRLQPKVPRDLEVICLKCLQKEPRKRYAGADALADDLQRFLTGQPIDARPTPAWERALKWARRRPALAAMTVLTVLVTALGVAGILWQLQRAEQRGLLARRRLYAAQVQLAQQAWQDGNIPHVLQLLESQRPTAPGQEDLRGFEWYYLLGLCHGDRLTLPGFATVAFRPDGQWLAAEGADHAVIIWDRDGRLVRSLAGHTRDVTCVAFRHDGQRLVSGSKDGTVKVWDATTGQELLTLPGQPSDPITSVAFSPDGQSIAAAGQAKTITLWDGMSGSKKLTFRGHLGSVRCVAFSPDGKRLVSGGADATVKVWNAQNGAQVLNFTRHPGAVLGVAFSPDGKRVASAGGDKTIEIWDAATGKEWRVLRGHSHWVSSVAFSPDGQRLVSGSWDRTVRLWDVTTGKELATFKGHTLKVTGVAFDPTDELLASAGTDGAVKLWDAAMTNQEARTWAGHKGSIGGIVYSADGSHIASAEHDRSVIVRDAHTGQEIRTFKSPAGRVVAMTFNSDRLYLATIGENDQDPHAGEIKIWEALSGQELATLRGHTGLVASVVFAADGQRLATVGTDNSIRIWDGSGRELARFPAPPKGIPSMAFTKDGSQLAMAGRDGTVTLWSVTPPTVKRLRTLSGHAQEINAVAFNAADDLLASACADQTVKVWDVHTGREVLALSGHDGSVTCVAFSPDGKRLASAGSDLGQLNKPAEVKVWDLSTGQELLGLRGPNRSAHTVLFSPDGKQLAASGGSYTQGEIKVWDATIGWRIASQDR